ncbi:MAG: ABC transporter substrate-binding protein [Actinomycetota bacterium]
MRGRRYSRLIAGLAAVTLLAAACGGDQAPQEQPGAGGILRTAGDSFEFTAGFDPSAEYLGTAWGYYSNLLVRTLVGYNHVSGAAGNELVPDLATDLPEISDDGLTYTFTLKDGITFGPPVDREIVAEDIVYAFERLGTESVAAGYAFYYTVIEGFEDFQNGKADAISGIEATDDKTISFTLTGPTGDFPFRVAMPATGPIPREVAECWEDATEYGRYVIASGPYMIEGSENLDITSCKAMEPISGFDPERRLSFVRNPNYDPATDSPEARENLLDGVEVLINTNVDDIYNKVALDELDTEKASGNPTGDVIRRFTRDAELEDQIFASSADRTWYLYFNLAQPPFDDVHVRKAANFVMDKAGLQRAWGGEFAGPIATHLMPPEMTGGTPTAEEYDPYPSEGFAGDVEAAKEEMALSKYDSDGDGLCDDPVCDNVLHAAANTPPFSEMVPVIESSFDKIGITINTREFEDAYTPIQTVAENIPIGSRTGWGKDYADASTFAVLWDSRSIVPTNNINNALVGLTPEIAADLEGITGNLDGIPSVDDDIDACNALQDQARIDCWIALDKKIMEDIVPWVPYLWASFVTVVSSAVTNYEFDQFSGEHAFAHMTVDPSLQKQ